MTGPALGVLLPRDLPAAEVLGYARRAEAAGAASLWVVEDLGFRGGVAQAAAVLAATTTLRVGIGILPAAVRNHAFLAMELATLEQLFPGRLDAGSASSAIVTTLRPGCGSIAIAPSGLRRLLNSTT